jgi:hypothetical protein
MVIPLTYIRLFVDDTGVSHFEDCTLPLETRDFAPPTRDRFNTFQGSRTDELSGAGVS